METRDFSVRCEACFMRFARTQVLWVVDSIYLCHACNREAMESGIDTGAASESPAVRS